MSEIATVGERGDLAISPQQTDWTPAQSAALVHIGVDKASEGDLKVFFHVCQRTGLDPFVKQIYMIGRESSERQPDGSWQKVVKQTIQTGIDGFRLIGRRAADRAGHSVSVGAAQWMHKSGEWRDVWTKDWGTPLAARVTITRDGETFTATANYDEYVQTKRDGSPTQMWAQRGAGQLAKCAEALAWRMSSPHDMSGIYADEEMGQVDNAPARVKSGGLASVLTTANETAQPAALDTTSDLAKAMFAAMNEAGVTDREQRLDLCRSIIGRPIESSSEMTEDDARAVLDFLSVEAQS